MERDKPAWIERTADLAAALAAVADGPLALDTEADSFHHYREKVCLVQLSFGAADLLVDPLAGVDLAVLAPALGRRGLRKILHGADYDLRLLHRDHALEIAGLFDTMVAARLAGERAFGLAALLERELGVVLDKRHQRADWSIRPLPAALREYAAADTRHLEELAGKLEERLARLGRSAWAEEEFAELERVRFRPIDRAERFRSMKGSGGLAPRALAVLRELHAVREESAERRDVPPFRVLRDETLVAAARAGGDAGASPALRAFPQGWSSERLAPWRVAIERALAIAEEDLPARRDGRPPRTPPDVERRVREMARERDRLAGELDIDPTLVAPRALLERAIAEADRGGDPAALPELRRWQAELLRPVLARAGR